MAENEIALLERFVGTGDTEAFARIVRQYAGLVYGTCLRILADTDRAADATQETFFQLMQRAGEVRGSLAGWLHRVATGKAVDLIRHDSARRRREHVYLDDRAREDQAWREVAPYVDEALTQLDHETRGLLVAHYLEGRSMADLARQRGVSRPTISREIESGLARLRGQLHRQGILVAVGALSTFLAQSTAQSAPAAVLQQLGKITMAGAGAMSVTGPLVSVPTVVSVGMVAAAKLKVVIAVAAVVIGAGLITYTGFSSKPPEAPPAPPVTQREDAGSRGGRIIRPSPQPAAPEAEPEAPSLPTGQDAAPAPAEPVPSAAAAPTETAAEQTVVPEASPTSKTEGFRLDLSSPEATVRSFTKAMVSGNAESVMACMLPGAVDYEDMQEVLDADPDDPAQRDEYEMRLWLQALDPDAEMPIISLEETERGTSVTWQVTFKQDCTLQGRTFRAGDTYNLDATVRPSGDFWLIDGL